MRSQLGSSKPSAAKPGEAGFILAFVLWMIALMGLVVMALQTWVEHATTRAETIQHEVDESILAENTETELVFMMGTNAASPRGLEVGRIGSTAFGSPSTPVPASNDFMANAAETDRYLGLDGRDYLLRGVDNHSIRIFDGKGLINLNFTTSEVLRRVLSVSVADESTTNSLTDTLLDYLDMDKFQRLHGAEEDDYIRLGLRPPADGLVITPYEIQQTLGWNSLKDLWQSDLKDPLFTACRSFSFNPNTAVEPALVANLPGVGPDAIKAILEQRQTRPFTTAFELSTISGTPFDVTASAMSLIAGQCFVIEVNDDTDRQRLRFSLTLQPTDLSRPWRTDYILRIPSKIGRAAPPRKPGEVLPSPEEVHSWSEPA